ncbi:hypothetical protein GI584_14485 [Gracilibacillus salitolerans]|uniref:Uncharacterized protein n=1 Tax=Gracilibacillus salitolerans TaxID=2663022 RepID=A0A5Q2TMU7_9BACI|nr:hypothetical protein GI584_14485 [Gracilibacillus salitolerans]
MIRKLLAEKSFEANNRLHRLMYQVEGSDQHMSLFSNLLHILMNERIRELFFINIYPSLIRLEGSYLEFSLCSSLFLFSNFD